MRGQASAIVDVFDQRAYNDENSYSLSRAMLSWLWRGEDQKWPRHTTR